MKSMKSTIVIFQDKMVWFMGIVLFAVCSGLSCWILYLTTLPTESSMTAVWIARVIFACTGLGLPIVFLVNPWRFFVWYVLSREGISCHTFFRKKRFLPYSAIPYIMHAKYIHGTKWRDYIVMSNRKLSCSELEHINHVAPQGMLLKIHYSETTKQKLMSVLPTKQQKILEGIKRS